MARELRIVYDDETQTVAVQFEQADFKTWDMVIAVLDMAKSQADFNRELGRMQSVKLAAEQQRQNMAIRNKLSL